MVDTLANRNSTKMFISDLNLNGSARYFSVVLQITSTNDCYIDMNDIICLRGWRTAMTRCGNNLGRSQAGPSSDLPYSRSIISTGVQSIQEGLEDFCPPVLRWFWHLRCLWRGLLLSRIPLRPRILHRGYSAGSIYRPSCVDSMLRVRAWLLNRLEM